MAVLVAKNERDLTKGPIAKNLILFAIPLIITNIMQLLFNATDIAVLRFMVDEKAVASVGATSSLTHLIVNFFVGLSVGSSVVLSRCVGANNVDKARRVVGTAVSISLIGGVMLLLIGVFGARFFLQLMY
jgi:Na+-driven multidrug efflux pump